MSVQAMAWAFSVELSPGPKFTLLALANFADEDGDCYPGQERLAQMTGQDVRTIQRHLKAMEESGILTRRHQYREDAGGRGGRTSDRYRLMLNGVTRQNDRKPGKGLPDTTPGGYPTSATGFPGTMPGEPSVEPSVEPSGGSDSLPLAVVPAKKPRRKSPELPIPRDWKPNEKHAAFAAEKDLDLSTEAMRFRNNAEQNDRRCVRWDAAFSNWLLKAMEYAQRDRRAMNGAGTPVAYGYETTTRWG